MFPLIHFYINKQLVSKPSPLLVLGGMWPDMSAACGMDRNFSHQMGPNFLTFCREKHPQAADLALGILFHGSTPMGVDFYADEWWEHGCKGWCFQKAVPYISAVAEVTGLPDDFLWWKSHNLVEIALELLTNEIHPEISTELVSLIANAEEQLTAARILNEYHTLDMEKTLQILANIKNLFIIENVSAETLAKNQMEGMKRRFGLDVNQTELEKIITRIKFDLRSEYEKITTSIERKIRTEIGRQKI